MKTDELLANFSIWLEGVLSEPSNPRNVAVLALISEQAGLASKLLAAMATLAELEQQMQAITIPLPLIPRLSDT